MFKIFVPSFLLMLFFLTGLASEPVSAQENGIDLFLRAIELQEGESAIRSGQISYELSKATATKKEIQDECDQKIAEFKRAFPDHPMAKTIINSIPDAVKDKYSKQQTFSGKFRFDYTRSGQKYLENQLIFDDNSQQPLNVIEKRTLKNGILQTEAVMLDLSVLQASVNDFASTVADFSQFGRVRGIAAGLMGAVIAEKGMDEAKLEIKKQITETNVNKEKQKTLEIVETNIFDEGQKVYTLESRIDGIVTQRYQIIPGLGYVCPLIQIYDLNSKNLIEEYTAEDFVLHASSGLYYPSVYIESHYDVSSGKLINKNVYKIEQSTLVLNEPMQPKDFSLDIANGIKVVDFRGGKNTQYEVDEPGVLSLAPGGLNLEKMSWLRKSGDLSRMYSDNEHLFVRILFMTLGLSLIIWSLVKRRRDKKNAKSLSRLDSIVRFDIIGLFEFRTVDKLRRVENKGQSRQA
ncbi:MAG: hypothetical protein Q4G68_02855 [Planctomycetia bacterium]|nr:hypothetical protein [Planctomycetia bacterium]